jgi:hypothetical protein
VTLLAFRQPDDPAACFAAVVLWVGLMGISVNLDGSRSTRPVRWLGLVLAAAGIALCLWGLVAGSGWPVIPGVALELFGILLGVAAKSDDPGPARMEESGRAVVRGAPFPARLRYGSVRGGEEEVPFVEFSCDLPESPLRLRVASGHWRGRLRRDPATVDIDVGSWAYLVSTNDVEAAASFLDADARARIERLDGVHSGSFLLEARPGTMIVRAAHRFGEDQRLRDFANGAVRIAQHLRARLEGVHVVATASREGSCRVCGCPLDGPIVGCVKCRTPHHADCWEYSGVCSVYACGSAVARRRE